MDQYDVDPQMKELFEKKSKQRAAAKTYFQNILYNPYRPINDGVPFDPALFRFSAMSAYHAECFKPSARSSFIFIVALSPIVLIYFYRKRAMEKKEQLLRSGVIKYEDRKFKLFS